MALTKIAEGNTKEIKRIEDKIRELENYMTVPKQEGKTQEWPYYLHAIMIHDGVAEMGHFFTYVYDRVKKVWWKFNDCFVTQQKEEDVMLHALGGHGYMSACGLVYISKHIAKQVDQLKHPLFSKEHAKRYNI